MVGFSGPKEEDTSSQPNNEDVTIQDSVSEVVVGAGLETPEEDIMQEFDVSASTPIDDQNTVFQADTSESQPVISEETAAPEYDTGWKA